MDVDKSGGAAVQGAVGVGGEGKKDEKEEQAGDKRDAAAGHPQEEGTREQGAVKAEDKGGSDGADTSVGGEGRAKGGADGAKGAALPKQEGQGEGQQENPGKEEGKSEEMKKQEGERKGEEDQKREEARKETDRKEGERKEGLKKGKKEKERERKERRDRKRKEMEKKSPEAQLSPFGVEQGALIWVQYMRFLRRTQDPTASRQLFLRARRWQQQSRAIALAAEAAATASPPGRPPLANGGPKAESGKGGSTSTAAGPTGWQVYAAMARMEWASDRSNTAIACRIFEKGLEDPKLAKDPAYTLAYHRFLIDAGDVDNARALFERTLAEPELLGCGELWRAYAAFEYEQGDLPAALQVESRMREAMASASGAEADRDYDRPGGGIDVGISGTLLQQSLQLALLKYTFEGAAPCTSQLQRHLLGSAGVLKGPSIEEEAAIAERFVRLHPEQFEELLPPAVVPEALTAAGKGADKEHPPGRVGPPSRWEEGPAPRERAEGRGRRVGPPERADRGDRDRDHGRDLGEPDLLELLARDLPPPLAVEGPLVPIEAVMDVVICYRNTPEAVNFVCTELDAGRVPNGVTGPSEGVPVPQILAMTPEGRKLLGEMGALPPASPGGGAFPPHPRYPPHPNMVHEPPPPAPFMGSYGEMGPVPFEEMPPHPAFHAGPPLLPPRKRGRWEEGRDTYTGYEADAGLPYSYHTPHPSQWYNDERPRKSHPAVRGRKQV